MKAKDIMTSDRLICAQPELAVSDVAGLMMDNDIGSVPICDEEMRLLGIVTDRDLCLRVLGDRLDFDTPVSEVMTRNVQTCHENDDLSVVEDKMRSRKVRRIPVIDDASCLCGYISTADLARHAGRDLNEAEMAQVIEKISEPGER